MNHKKNNTKIALKLNNISKLYPGTIALRKVNLEILEGKVHGLIGKNGAGKTTLVNLISGVTSPTQGDIYIKNKWFKSLSRIDAKKEGITIVTQEPQIVPEFNVAETFFSPDYILKNKFINWKKMISLAKEIMEKIKFDLDVEMKMGELSISTRQFILILKAFYLEKASIIILDEASASLSKKDGEILFKIISTAKDQGKTIIYISHRMDEILKVCDRVTVLRDGETIITKDCSELDERKLSSFIIGDKNMTISSGKLKKTIDDNVKTKKEETVLQVRNLTKVGYFWNINFELKKGEILGIAGLRGSGRTEILKSIVGAEKPDIGEILVCEKTKKFRNPCHALRNGIVYLPEERDKEGIILDLSVRENIVLSKIKDLVKFVLINASKENNIVKNLIKELNIITPSSEQEIKNLSGGNKQKVVVGKIMVTNPKIILLDEPTKGIDIETKANILKLIKEELSKKSSIIMTSPGLDELIEVCDRIIVLYEGKIVSEYNKKDFDEENIYLAMQNVV